MIEITSMQTLWIVLLCCLFGTILAEVRQWIIKSSFSNQASSFDRMDTVSGTINADWILRVKRWIANTMVLHVYWPILPHWNNCKPPVVWSTTVCMRKNHSFFPREDLINTRSELRTSFSLCYIIECFFLGPNNTYTCCSPDQISNMANQFGMAKLMLGRCPSCYYNFRSIFCAMTCSPDHSRFISVNDRGNSSKFPGQVTVESINYLMADDFGQRIVDSCRWVRLALPTPLS